MLSENQKRYLRRLAHERKPVVLLGAAGASDAVIDEVDQALRAHELVKVRIRAEDRTARELTLQTLCRRTGGELVQRIGHVAVLYRRHPDRPRIMLPDR